MANILLDFDKLNNFFMVNLAYYDKLSVIAQGVFRDYFATMFKHSLV